MIEIKDVIGSKEASQSLIIGIDTVYVHSNIRPYTNENNPEMKDMFVYDEIQYEKDEYIKLMSEKDKETEKRVAATEEMILDMSTMVYA